MAENSTNSVLKDAAAWIAEVDRYMRGKADQQLSTGGVFFNPDVQENGHGGFFPAVTEENREKAIRTLLKDQPDQGRWFIEYLNTGKTNGLNAEQKQFVASYDRFTSSFLDARSMGFPEEAQQLVASGGLSSEDFAQKITKDQTLTDAEYRTLMKEGGFDADVKKMGSLGLPFIYLTGGIVQGAMDNEPTASPIRTAYAPKELAPFYSPEGKLLLDEKNRTLGYVNPNAPFDLKLSAYVEQMNNSCGTDASLEFKPGTTPARVIPENQESYER